MHTVPHSVTPKLWKNIQYLIKVNRIAENTEIQEEKKKKFEKSFVVSFFVVDFKFKLA